MFANALKPDVQKPKQSQFYKTRLDTVLIPVRLPNDTVHISDTVKIINNKCYFPYQLHRVGIISVEVFIKNNFLDVKAYLNDSTYIHKHYQLVTEVEHWKQQYESKTSIIELNKINKWQRMQMIGFWVLAAITGTLIYIRLKTGI